jgi:thiol-disulfide isomerase/thioredoxin
MKSIRALTALGLVVAFADWQAATPVLANLNAEKKGVRAPEFSGISEWLNAKPMKMADQKDSVVVVHFWTNGCINCIHNYPYYQKWMDKYNNRKDFQMIGIHTPELEQEKNLDRLKEKIKKHKLAFPVAVDNQGATWKAWNNQYWPSIYLVDKAGNVRQLWNGELRDMSFRLMSEKIDALLKE